MHTTHQGYIIAVFAVRLVSPRRSSHVQLYATVRIVPRHLDPLHCDTPPSILFPQHISSLFVTILITMHQ